MSRTQLLIARAQSVQIDILWLLCTLIAFLIFLYIPVYVDSEPTLAVKSIIGFSFLVGGTVMTLLLCGFRSDRFFSLGEIANSLGYIFVSIICIYAVNIYTSTLQLSAVPISGALFMVLMGISEEALFRGFLTTLFVKMTGSSLIAVGLSSLVGMVYHAAVYGSSNTNLAIVFGSFFVLGFVYVLSNYRLSVPMVAHAIVNALANMG